MRRLSVLLLSSLALAASDTVLLELEKSHNSSRLHRRGDTVEADLLNLRQKSVYFAKVQVGNPRQDLTLVVDTGSSDTWAPWSGCTICRNKQCDWGSYNPDDSQTYQSAATGALSLSYADKSYAYGNYFTDDFAIENAVIANLTMGIGLKTSIPHGLMGLGYAINEGSVSTVGSRYANLPLAMAQANLIKSVAYSLWLNDLSASKGNILFGGIDTSKYVGNMTRIPVLKDSTYGIIDHFRVSLTSLTASSPSGIDALTSSKFPFPVVLDSGATLSYLPDDLAHQIWKEVGASYDAGANVATVPCSYANHKGNFSFGFAGDNGPRIDITMDELVIPSKGSKMCAFGIQNQTTGESLLGDTFLRSAYVVYDLVNNEIGLAATDFNSKESNVVAFKSSGARIPLATAVSDKKSVANATLSASAAPTATGGLTAAKGFQDDNGSIGAVTSVSMIKALLCTAVGIAFVL